MTSQCVISFALARPRAIRLRLGKGQVRFPETSPMKDKWRIRCDLFFGLLAFSVFVSAVPFFSEWAAWVRSFTVGVGVAAIVACEDKL